MTDESPFKVGTEVYKVRRSNWAETGIYQSATVAKVYKNGNFTLEGSNQQWKPSQTYHDGGRSWGAYPTGDTTFNRTRVIPVNEETLARRQREETEARRLNAAQDLLNRMNHAHAIVRNRFTTEDIAAMTAILDKYTKG